MGLKQIQKGILSMDGLPFDTGESPVVVVHPFYELYKDIGYPVRYLKNMDEFLSSRKGPIVTLEEDEYLTRTSVHYRFLGRNSNTLFIKTKLASPDPKDVTWDELASFIDSLRHGRKVSLVGGYLNGTIFGCLGVTDRKLWERRIPTQVLEGLTF